MRVEGQWRQSSEYKSEGDEGRGGVVLTVGAANDIDRSQTK